MAIATWWARSRRGYGDSVAGTQLFVERVEQLSGSRELDASMSTMALLEKVLSVSGEAARGAVFGVDV